MSSNPHNQKLIQMFTKLSKNYENKKNSINSNIKQNNNISIKNNSIHNSNPSNSLLNSLSKYKKSNYNQISYNKKQNNNNKSSKDAGGWIYKKMHGSDNKKYDYKKNFNYLGKKRKFISKEEEKEYKAEMEASAKIDKILAEIKKEKKRKQLEEEKKNEELKIKLELEKKKKEKEEEKKAKKKNIFLEALGMTEEEMKKNSQNYKQKSETNDNKEDYLKNLLNNSPKNSLTNFGKINSNFIKIKDELPKYWKFKVTHGDIYKKVLSFDFYNTKINTEKVPDYFDNELHYRYIWVTNFFNELKYCLLNEKAEKSDLQNYKEADIKIKFIYIQEEFTDISLLRVYANKNLSEFKKKIFKDKDIIAIYPENENINFDEINISNKNNLNYFIGVIKIELDSHELKILIRTSDVDKYNLNYNNYNQNIKRDELFKIKYLNNINSSLREFNALLCLELSCFKDLLNPKNLLTKKNNPQSDKLNLNLRKSIFLKYIKSSNKYNSSQIEVLIKANNMKKNELLLIQGPPGTGKTHTILGLVSLFMLEGNPRILICTQSNTAIDEICNRLINKGLYNEKLQIIKSNFIRFGYTDRRDKEKKYLDTKQGKLLEKYSLDYLIDCKFKEQLENDNFEKEKIIKEINMLSDDKEKNAEQIRILENKKQVLLKAIAKSKHEKQNYEYYLLSNSPILCTTLNNAGNERLKKNNLTYDILIVDEACQCVEPSCLIPLCHGIKKLILVGDHKQLPSTVFYPKANSILYNRSLFERLIDNHIPRHILTIQYRMQKNIRRFISDLFYESKLEDSQDKEYIEKINKNPFYSIIDINKNFTFFDLNFSEEKFDEIMKSYYNKQEIDFVYFLIKKINFCLEKIPKSNEYNYKFAIITPYQAQVKRFKEEKNKYNELSEVDIGINTVDSFQGQEREIVIFSTVRSNNINDNTINLSTSDAIGFLNDFRRMNVALSRAKLGCFIVGNSQKFKNDPYWEKLINFCKNKKSFFVINSINDFKQGIDYIFLNNN